MPSRRYRFGLIVEQALGHATHALNLQRAAPLDPEMEPVWGLIPYEVGWPGSLAPLFRSNWTVRAGLRARRQLASMARGGPLDALFIHTQVPAVLASDWVRRIPTVVSLDATPLQYDELGAAYAHTRGPAWLERLKWRLNRAVFHRARHLVTWSGWTRQGLIDGYGVDPARVTIVHPGVETAAWTQPEPRREHAGPVRVLFVGGDAARKGGLRLVAAVRTLRETLAVELDLVTRTPMADEPGVRLHAGVKPNSAELQELFRKADIFCLPSEADCLALALVEAAAAGLPSVSTAIAAIPEIVLEGQNGLLVTPRDHDGLVNALRLLATDAAMRLRMGERAAVLAAREFDATTNARRLFDLLKQVADGAPGSDLRRA